MKLLPRCDLQADITRVSGPSSSFIMLHLLDFDVFASYMWAMVMVCLLLLFCSA